MGQDQKVVLVGPVACVTAVGLSWLLHWVAALGGGRTQPLPPHGR